MLGLISSPTIIPLPYYIENSLGSLPFLFSFPLQNKMRIFNTLLFPNDKKKNWNDGQAGSSGPGRDPACLHWSCALSPGSQMTQVAGPAPPLFQPFPAICCGQITDCLWTSLYSPVKWGEAPEEWEDSMRWFQETCFIKCSSSVSRGRRARGWEEINQRPYVHICITNRHR